MIPINVLARAYNTPLMITPEKWAALMGVIGRGQIDLSILQQQLNAELVEEAAVPTSRSPQVAGADRSVAVIPIIGSLVARGSGTGTGSGLLSYQTIKNELMKAVENPGIGAIMLDAASHGGEASGCFAIADLIREINGYKPVWAHINEAAYSACYAMVSAAGRVLLTPTAGGGSIGVLMAHVDKSAKFEQLGEKTTYIYSGAKKIDGNPNGPLDKRVLEELQARVDTMRDIFATKVDEFRNLKPGTAKATEAGTYMGNDLIEAGLADGIASFDDAYKELSEKINSSRRKKTMNTKQRMAALIAGNDDAVEALAELGYVACDVSEKATAELDLIKAENEQLKSIAEKAEEDAKAKVEATISGALEVVSLCNESGIQAFAEVLLKDKVITAAAAAPLIIAEKAALDGKTRVESGVGAEVKKGAEFVDFMRKKHSPQA